MNFENKRGYFLLYFPFLWLLTFFLGQTRGSWQLSYSASSKKEWMTISSWQRFQILQTMFIFSLSESCKINNHLLLCRSAWSGVAHPPGANLLLYDSLLYVQNYLPSLVPANHFEESVTNPKIVIVRHLHFWIYFDPASCWSAACSRCRLSLQLPPGPCRPLNRASPGLTGPLWASPLGPLGPPAIYLHFKWILSALRRDMIWNWTRTTLSM